MAGTEFGPHAHPEPDLLLSRASGLLDADVAARIDAHVQQCDLCSLELKRAARFQELDGDDEAAAEADWDTASARLDAAWQQSIQPVAVPSRRRLPRWLAPVAAAAVVALIVFNVGDRALHDPLGTGEDKVRGLPSEAPAILADGPTGPQTEAPIRFTWSSERKFDSYDLEVFTENLVTVFRLEKLTVGKIDLPDSLRNLFAPDTTYFWHIEGHEGLTATEASATVWFRIEAASAR